MFLGNNSEANEKGSLGRKCNITFLAKLLCAIRRARKSTNHCGYVSILLLHSKSFTQITGNFSPKMVLCRSERQRGICWTYQTATSRTYILTFMVPERVNYTRIKFNATNHLLSWAWFCSFSKGLWLLQFNTCLPIIKMQKESSVESKTCFYVFQCNVNRMGQS